MDYGLSSDLLFEYDIKESQVGDFRTTTDKKQSIIIRLSTPYGSNLFHPDYGNKAYDILSESMDDNWLNRIMAYEKECVEQDLTLKIVRIESSVVHEERKVSFNIKYIDLESNETNELIWGEKIA